MPDEKETCGLEIDENGNVRTTVETLLSAERGDYTCWFYPPTENVKIFAENFEDALRKCNKIAEDKPTGLSNVTG
ncbi:hypothetical protein RMSM_02048 [Rhodopirellula maiorica SM1]|uniref:Uncharacterized protein n=1 Tax=Rhodopirellula maiorica SM1 TaxID=1265738 RepID=M5RP94_9BACT|nr:hypothetical protein [Rhodopirellula maiorica]EMI21031.1 hypothetical protein RMSM_02048 [Rhodopirellula maiorica SM1]